MDEAVETLKEEYDTRTETLRDELRELEAARTESDTERDVLDSAVRE